MDQSQPIRLVARAGAAVLLSLLIVEVACTRNGADPRATGGIGGPSTSSVTEDAAAPCHGKQLSGREVLTDPAAGNVWAPILLRNTSPRACTMTGYPRVRFLDVAGDDLHLMATHSPDDTRAIPPLPIPRSAFVLEPSAKSWFIVHFTDVESPCRVVNRMLVVPPGGNGKVTVRVSRQHEWDVCAGPLSVTAATLNEPNH